jgi:hypothetical protein
MDMGDESVLTPVDSFLCEPLKKHIHEVSPRTAENLVARFQAVVRRVDANMLRRVRCNAVRRSAVCLETDGDHP